MQPPVVSYYFLFLYSIKSIVAMQPKIPIAINKIIPSIKPRYSSIIQPPVVIVYL